MTRLAVVLLAFIFIISAATPQGFCGYVQEGTDGKTWAIGNEVVERQIRFDPNGGLYTASWKDKATGTDFMKVALQQKHGGEEFSFFADGKRYAGAGGGAAGGFELVRGGWGNISPGGKELTVLLEARDKRFRVGVHYAIYDHHPVVRKWIDIVNVSDTPSTLTHLTFEGVNIAPCSPDDLQVSGFYGVEPREIFFTGRVDDTAITVRCSRTGEGFVAMNEAPGYLKRTEIAFGWRVGLAFMYDTDLFPFERTLAPKESFTSAKSSVAFFQDGAGMADPHWVVPSYTSEVLFKKGPRYQPPWIYNTWEPFYRGINSEIVSGLIPIAGRMGLDVFTLDDGWQQDYGENRINLKAFPHGLEEVNLLAGRNNMRLGLWVPLAAISVDTAVYREHPEWVCRDSNGEPKFTRTAAGARAVMCLATPYKVVAAKRISDLISRYHLKYVKIDLTTVFNTYGEAPGCYAKGHEHRTWAESLVRIYEGMQYVTDYIYREHPDVLLDLTYELWGQKHLIDYGLLAAGDLDWLSNVDDSTPDAAGPRQARTLLYLRSLAIPTEAMLIGNLRASTPPIEERLATAIGSGPLFLGDLRKLTPAEQAWYGEKIRWFKNLRERVPISEGFFPMGNWRQPSAADWDGFARLSRRGEGLITIFKNQSGVAKVEVKLPVYPDGEFTVRSVMTGRTLGKYKGEQFRKGIEFSLPEKYQAEILEVRR